MWVALWVMVRIKRVERRSVSFIFGLYGYAGWNQALRWGVSKTKFFLDFSNILFSILLGWECSIESTVMENSRRQRER